MPQLSADARDLNWLLSNLATRTPGVAHAMVVSADGLPIAVSERLDRGHGRPAGRHRLGVASLSQGAARYFDAGTVKQTVVEMQRGFLLVMAISDGSCLTVLAATSCDVGGVGYEMATLVTRAGEVLTPACGPSCRPPCHHERPTSRRWAGQGSASPSPTQPGRQAGSTRAGHAGPARQVRHRHDGTRRPASGTWSPAGPPVCDDRWADPALPRGPGDRGAGRHHLGRGADA